MSMSMKWPVYEMSCLWNVNVYETTCLWNVLSMECPVYEMYSYEMSISMKCQCLWNGLSMKSPIYKMYSYEMSRQAKIKTYSIFMNFISMHSLNVLKRSKKSFNLKLFFNSNYKLLQIFAINYISSFFNKGL